MNASTRYGLSGRVQVFDPKTGVLLWESHNDPTAAGLKLLTDFLNNVSVEGIKYLALEDATGEIFRKAYTSITYTSNTETLRIFSLSEVEPATPPYTLTKLKLVGDTATLTLDTGIDIAEVAFPYTKGIYQALQINWTTKTEEVV